MTLRRGGAEPGAFLWEGRRYAVERVEACWKEVGPWWDGEGEHTFFRVTACYSGLARPRGPASGAALPPAPGVYELRFDHAAERWWLHEVID